MKARRSSLLRPLIRPARRSRGPFRQRVPLRAVALGGALTLGALTLTACGGDSAADDGKVSVVTSFYPMEFLTREIGGDHVSVSTLTGPGTEPHGLELSPRQVGEIGEADLVVYVKGLQPAVDTAVEQSGAEHLAEATSFVSLEKNGAGEHGEEHREEQAGAHGEEHSGEHGHGDEHTGEDPGHEESGHEGHDHSTADGDPHVWLDPVRYAKIAEGVSKKLAEADPEHAPAYEKNADRLVQRLEKLDRDFTAGLKDRTGDTFLTTHAAFGYLADRYGLHEESIAGLDPESGSVSGAHLKELHTLVEEDGVSTVFTEPGAEKGTARALAGDLDLKTDVLNPVAVVQPGEQDYFTVMRQNLQALRTALGAA
ncbi:metal ABC transporter substrate-binding protein [Streptomyces sp. JJ36]|uniref:metal ABC transporter substrate-binding protein n=1 Tax=Streptomyces sp. JJ36 TaxID=2736645 RepID=UPI001F3B80A5|nr:metal ABC transporter substrate-binding protein [Streptomyces sp. JJ36]MCF6521724.1 zinc ABC transporter substrate-binding protein [Streptomyces sp. JJ36]